MKLKRVITGLRTFFGSLSYLWKHSLYGYAILPAIVGVLLGGVLITAIILTSGAFADWILQQIPESARLPAILILIRIAVIVGGSALVVLIYRPLVSLTVLPSIEPLLKRIERIEIGREIDVPLSRDIRNALVGAFVGFQAALSGMLAFVVSLPLGPVQGPIMFLVESYILGRGAFDFVFEKETETVSSRKELTKQFRPEILGVGIGFFLVLTIPILGIAMGPVLAVSAAARIRHAENKIAVKSP